MGITRELIEGMSFEEIKDNADAIGEFGYRSLKLRSKPNARVKAAWEIAMSERIIRSYDEDYHPIYEGSINKERAEQERIAREAGILSSKVDEDEAVFAKNLSQLDKESLEALLVGLHQRLLTNLDHHEEMEAKVKARIEQGLSVGQGEYTRGRADELASVLEGLEYEAAVRALGAGLENTHAEA